MSRRAARTSRAPARPAEDPVRTVLGGALLVVSLGALFRGIDAWLGHPTQAVLLSAVVVSFAMGRAGVPSAPFGGRAVRRALVAAGAVVLVVGLAVAVEVALGARYRPRPLGGSVLYAIIESLGRALRDEVWLHGIPLTFAARAGLSLRAGATFAVLASVAAVALEPGTTAVGLLVVASSSAAFVRLWLCGRDAWAPVAAHFAFVLSADALLAGDGFVVERGIGGVLAAGSSAEGVVAAVAAVAFTALAGGASRLPLPPATAADMADEAV
ncbi:MAG: hypothetical protein AAGN82_32020 [Myxococcota bacterium]